MNTLTGTVRYRVSRFLGKMIVQVEESVTVWARDDLGYNTAIPVGTTTIWRDMTPQDYEKILEIRGKENGPG